MELLKICERRKKFKRNLDKGAEKTDNQIQRLKDYFKPLLEKREKK